jgi:hypothetical protein
VPQKQNLKGSRARATQSLDGLGLRNVSEKIEDSALELGGLEAEGGGVKCAGRHPELLGTDCGVIDAPCVAAGEFIIILIADEEDRKHASRDRFFRRDFGYGKTREFFAVIKQCPTERP